MDESFPLPGHRAELNWKLLFIPPVSRRRIRFVCNWFKLGGSFAEERLRFYLLMEKMIEFVLSRVPLRLLSSYPLPVSVNQIISLPCQHTLLVEQSKLICKRSLWFILFSLFVCFLPLLLSPVFFFSFCPLFFRSPHRQSVLSLRVLLPHSERKDFSYSFSWQSRGARFTCCIQALMRWWILSQAGDVSH